MNLIPKENIIYRTKLSKEKVIEKLNNNVQLDMHYGWLGKSFDCPYHGDVYEDSFSIERCISGRNSFLPKIKGVYAEDDGGTVVNVTMRLNKFVLGFMILWLGGVFLGCVVVIYAMISEMYFRIEMLFPYGMFLFGLCLCLIPFKYECNKSKKDLQNIFEAEIIK